MPAKSKMAPAGVSVSSLDVLWKLPLQGGEIDSMW